jgi:hypothetical protein
MKARHLSFSLLLILCLHPLALAQNNSDKTAVLLGVMNKLFGPSVNSLVNAGSVKREIALSPEQDQQIAQLRKSVPSELKQTHPEIMNDKKKALSKMNLIQETLNARIFKILTPAQLERVLQIQLQLQAYNQGLVTVFASKDLRQAFDFTAEQNATIEEMATEHARTIKGLFAGKQPGSVRPTLDAYHAKANPKIMALLNESQRKLWDKLVGKPFDFANNQDLPIRR